MALPPSLWPARLIDQSFGMCITPNDFFFPFYNTYNTNYYRPWKWCMQGDVKDFGSTIDNSKDYFKVILDVQQFRPNEISVKVVNNQVLVEGKHEERIDEHGFVARQFTRRYALPNACKPEDVESNLSSDGVLTISARKSAQEFKVTEKIVPIQLSKSCPTKEQKIVKVKSDTNQQVRSDECKKVDSATKNTQIMLKEDHCCLLLKPELLRDAASESTEIKSELKKEKYEKEQVKSEEQAAKNTSEMLEQSFGKSSVAMSKAKISEQTCQSSEATASSSGKAGQSSMTKAQMSELTGTSLMSSECIESSSCYKSSMTSNTHIEEISEELSDFVSDILCSELDITRDSKK